MTTEPWYISGAGGVVGEWRSGGEGRGDGGGVVCVTCCHLSGTAATSLEILGCCLRVLYHHDKCSLEAVQYQHAQRHETHSD